MMHARSTAFNHVDLYLGQHSLKITDNNLCKAIRRSALKIVCEDGTFVCCLYDEVYIISRACPE